MSVFSDGLWRPCVKVIRPQGGQDPQAEDLWSRAILIPTQLMGTWDSEVNL